MDDREAEIDKLEREIINLENRLDVDDKERNRTIKELKEVTEKLTVKDQKLQELQKRGKELKNLIEIHKTTSIEMNEKLETAQKTIELQRKEIKWVKEQEQMLRKERDNLVDRKLYEDMKGQLEERSKVLRNLWAKLGKLKDEYFALNDENKKTMQKNSKLVEQITILKESSKVFESKLNALRQKNGKIEEAMQDELNARIHSSQSLKQEIIVLQKKSQQIESLRYENLKLRQSISSNDTVSVHNPTTSMDVCKRNLQQLNMNILKNSKTN